VLEKLVLVIWDLNIIPVEAGRRIFEMGATIKFDFFEHYAYDGQKSL